MGRIKRKGVPVAHRQGEEARIFPLCIDTTNSQQSDSD